MYNDNQRARGLPMDWPSSAFTSGWIAIIHTLWLFGGFQIVMVPTVIIHFKLECSIINSINHPFGISHIYGNHHILETNHFGGPQSSHHLPSFRGDSPKLRLMYSSSAGAKGSRAWWISRSTRQDRTENNLRLLSHFGCTYAYIYIYI